MKISSRLVCTAIMIYFHLFSLTISAQDAETAFVAWHPDGRFVAVALDNSVQIFNQSTHETVNAITGLATQVTAPAWSPDGTLLAIGNQTNLEIWQYPHDPELATRIATFDNNSPGLRTLIAIAWHSTEAVIAVSGGAFVNYWDMNTQSLVTAIEDDPELANIFQLSWDSTGERLAITRLDGTVEVRHYEDLSVSLKIIMESYLDGSGFYINPYALSVDWSPHGEVMHLFILQRVTLR